MKNVFHLVVELVRASTSGDDAELSWARAIELRLFLLEIIYKINAKVYSIGFKAEEVESTSAVRRPNFTGEVHQFCKGSANLVVVTLLACLLSFNVLG